MRTIEVDILNPKADKLIETLADLQLIAIKTVRKDAFLDVVKKLRKKAEKNLPSLSEITKEVESVRTKRYAETKKKSHS